MDRRHLDAKFQIMGYLAIGTRDQGTGKRISRIQMETGLDDDVLGEALKQLEEQGFVRFYEPPGFPMWVYVEPWFWFEGRPPQ